MLLVLVEHAFGVVPEAGREALTAGRALAGELGVDLGAVIVGAVVGPSGNGDADDADDRFDAVVDACGEFGADVVHRVDHELFTDYGPEAWGAALVELVASVEPAAVIAVGTDRGNEVLAQAAARLGAPFVANCLTAAPGEPWTVSRVQWGGSLIEDATVAAEIPILSFAPHAVEAVPAPSPGGAEIVEFEPDLDPTLARTIVADRTVMTTGVTLPTAPVVVGGGRGVGSAEGFAPLEALAALLGGVVGCSRAVTNNGWRPHRDQVGQTGTRIAPELYIASGISGAIQHWVGAAASKKILAINTDPEANMVRRADYAVIGDLHTVIPAIEAEVRRRRG